MREGFQKKKNKVKGQKEKNHYKPKSDGFLLCDLMRFSRIKDEYEEGEDKDEKVVDFTRY